VRLIGAPIPIIVLIAVLSHHGGLSQHRGSPGADNSLVDSCCRTLSRGLAGGHTFKFRQTSGREAAGLARLRAAT
jgi:hypothetical protein